jgi:2-desacetyl-2-hydroxyethyl bacteriochlorophyllide A dehydrogenase
MSISEKMTAVVFEGNGKYALKEISTPKIKTGNQVLIEVEAASICGTDIHILDVPPGHPANAGVILGHEYLGYIVDKGAEVQDYKIGDRVVIEPNLFCGNCYYCKMGRTNMCLHNTCLGIFVDGGFAKYSLVPSNAIHRLSKEIPVEAAIFAEPLSCVVSAMRKMQVNAGENALVLGAGPIGLYFIQMLKAAGAGKIIVSEISKFRTDYAYKCGATRVINPDKENLEDIICEMTLDGVDVSVDAVGLLINNAITCTRSGGRILLFGMNNSRKQEISQNTITRKDLTIIGNYVSSYMFGETVKILESGMLPLKELVTHKLKLEDIQIGIDAMKKGEALEVIVYP